MDFALAQLALIFMPGIIWASIDSKYGSGFKHGQTIFFVRIFLFGMITYFMLYLLYSVFGFNFSYADLGIGSGKINLIEFLDEIGLSIPSSLVLSVIWLWAVRFRLLTIFLHWIKATCRYGNEDVWSFTLNSDGVEFGYVHFRDLENGFVFSGYVWAYSENEDCRELLLRDAIVYNDEQTELLKSP